MNNIDILEELKPKKIDLITLIRAFKKEGIDDFIVIRKEKFETLIAENKELKEENKKLTDEYMIQKHLINAEFLDDYIQKSKVEEKIEELEEEIEEKAEYGRDFTIIHEHEIDTRGIIEVLQSLLGKE